MHVTDLNNHKDKLKCTFCRNPLANDEITIKEYKGDFVSVWCPNCKDYPKQCGPKFLICLCSKEPKELEIEMAKSEIEANTKIDWQDLPNMKLVNQDKGSDKDEITKEYVSKVPKKHKRSVSTRF